MEDLRPIFTLWKQARAASDDLCLVTVVRVEGSSYRKPGARMLLTRPGLRAGTISGGCLEGEVQKKAWWLTRHGSAVERYSTFFDDDAEIPYGLGCGGTIWLMMERGEIVDQVLRALESSSAANEALVLGAIISGSRPGTCLIEQGDKLVWQSDPAADLACLAGRARESQASQWQLAPEGASFFAEYAVPPQRLFVFGAGDDAQPVVTLAASLGWSVTAADGRPQLAVAQRFPAARSVQVVNVGDTAALAALNIRRDDAVVLMTHSYEQDRWLLSHFLRSPQPPDFLGVMGPRSRTRRLLFAADCPPEWIERLHSPVGLDIGSNSPAEIALSIVAQVQAMIRSKRSKHAPAAVDSVVA